MNYLILDTNIFIYLSKLLKEPQKLKDLIVYIRVHFQIEKILLPQEIEQEIKRRLKNSKREQLLAHVQNLIEIEPCTERQEIILFLIEKFMHLDRGEADALQQLIVLTSSSNSCTRYMFITNDKRAHKKLQCIAQQFSKQFACYLWEDKKPQIEKCLGFPIPP